MAKTLEANSKYAKYDNNGDGIVTDEEFDMDRKLVRLENEDKKSDAQLNMAWFALLLYPVTVSVCSSTSNMARLGISG